MAFRFRLFSPLPHAIRLTAILLTISVLEPSSAIACPLVGSLVDFNCDRKHVVSVVGDSIVFGTGDEKNNGNGGYVQRIQQSFPTSKVHNFGYPGITTNQLLAYYKRLFATAPRGSEISQLGASDIVIIDVGRNDYFNRNSSTLTATTIKRLTTYLASELERRFGTAPLFVTTVLPLSRREIDLGFIQQVNMVLLKIRGKSFPAYLQFNTLSPTLLGADGLHPTSAGYDVLGRIAVKYISGPAQTRSKAARKDADRDGLYDIFERSKFKTAPKKKDTDEDGLSDGAEVFTHTTNPLEADSDGDGVDDGIEISLGTDPSRPDATSPTPSPN